MGLAANAKHTTNLCLVFQDHYIGNVSYVTCDSRTQKCCDDGCCERVFVLDKEENLWLAWMMVLFISFLMSFTIICVKMLCRESCKRDTQDQSSIANVYFENRGGGAFVQRQPQQTASRRVVFLHVSNENITSPEEHLDNIRLEDVESSPPPSYEEVVSGEIT